jgi:uncharacterized protein
MSDDPRWQLLDVELDLFEAHEVTTTDNRGFSALHRAAMGGDLPSLDRLLASGTATDERSRHAGVYGGVTALHCAIAGGHLAIVDRLLAAGASVEARDGAGYTPLGLAVELGHYPIVKRLIRAGARPTVEVGDCALQHLAQRGGHAPVVALLRQVLGMRSR